MIDTATTERIDLGWSLVKLQVELERDARAAYDAFVNDLGRWWARGYTMDPETTDMVLEGQAGGDLVEKCNDERRVIWANVTVVAPGRMIRLGIPEGVMWSGPGYVSVKFSDRDGSGALLELEHGSSQLYTDDGHAGYAASWQELVGERFRAYVAGEQVVGSVRS